MFTATTEGVKVSVQTEFQPFYSNAKQQNYVFSYKIHIENESDQTVQLLSRHWHIIDGLGFHREVIGDGVIGVQPVIEPGETHSYVSGCNLSTFIGKMYGIYVMERVVDGKRFEVKIPEFMMSPPYLSN
ncbi:Co2+/Mg2+ efflux protein ApaG [Jiulongibacter sediminis]|uniref:Cobalt transporter n=1 Tax=Jiulongibacter sediminis TaxID=1605367 RepID=A0A0N8HA85_9BACT|nr:Co2+/Mg2+ efflux protein ApaG [Jiulongibacter sediminis]KPM49468.1 cobalt transporter [Jiulongibacter sediminis]TBX26516.1 cobalt transporter [Jiulongibacter sediminis]